LVVTFLTTALFGFTHTSYAIAKGWLPIQHGSISTPTNLNANVRNWYASPAMLRRSNATYKIEETKDTMIAQAALTPVASVESDPQNGRKSAAVTTMETKRILTTSTQIHQTMSSQHLIVAHQIFQVEWMRS
jgi:hypothetical protein